jgi:hypothetical protein
MKNRYLVRSRSSASTSSFSSDDSKSIVAPMSSVREELDKSGRNLLSIKDQGATPGFICTDSQNHMSIIKTGAKGRGCSEVISEHLSCSVAQYMFELLEQQNYDVPKGLSRAIPKTNLMKLDNVEYVESVFLPKFQDIHKILGENKRGEDRKRSKIKSRSRMHKIIRAIEGQDLQEPHLKKELCWLLAYRQLVRDRDGHSENFGIIEHEDGSKHIGIIDMGLAHRNIGEHKHLELKDFHDKGLISHKLYGEASPNHLADYHKLYLDPEFKKATEVFKGFFGSLENQGKISDHISGVLEEVKQTFGEESVEEYKTKWCKIDQKTDLASALCSIYKTRSQGFEQSISKLETRLNSKIKKSELLTKIAQSAVEGLALMSNLSLFPLVHTTAFVKTSKSQRKPL